MGLVGGVLVSSTEKSTKHGRSCCSLEQCYKPRVKIPSLGEGKRWSTTYILICNTSANEIAPSDTESVDTTYPVFFSLMLECGVITTLGCRGPWLAYHNSTQFCLPTTISAFHSNEPFELNSSWRGPLNRRSSSIMGASRA
jgi:hypothetical protein